MRYLTYRQLKNGLGIHFSKDEGEGGASGGSGGGAGGNPPNNSANAAPNPDPAARIAELEAELKKFKEAKPPNPDPDLVDRTRRSNQADDEKLQNQKRLENALKFGMNAPAFLKQNESLLPKEIGDIFRQADKENFSDAIEKDAAIKAGVIQSFFSVQANVDLLTSGQKSALDDYLKLTKTGKQERSQQTYDMIFEPAFEMLKKTKRAEALQKGHSGGSDSENAYKQKMMNLSRKHYLGEKEK